MPSTCDDQTLLTPNTQSSLWCFLQLTQVTLHMQSGRRLYAVFVSTLRTQRCFHQQLLPLTFLLSHKRGLKCSKFGFLHTEEIALRVCALTLSFRKACARVCMCVCAACDTCVTLRLCMFALIEVHHTAIAVSSLLVVSVCEIRLHERFKV